MAKQTVNFRFSEETLQILDALSKEWDCTRTKVIERALRSSARHEEAHRVELPQDASEKLRTIKPPAKRGRVEPEKVRSAVQEGRGSLKRTETIPKPDWKK